jgi:hypothetical protein
MRRHANSPRRPGRPDPEAVEAVRVGAELRAEAMRHTPDSAAMLARVRATVADAERGPARTPGRHRTGARPWLRPAVATGVLVLAAGGLVAVLRLDSRPAGTSPLAASTPRDASSTAASGGRGAGVEDRSATATTPSASPTGQVTPSTSPSATAGSGAPAGSWITQGFLSSNGYIDPYSSTDWSQSDLILNNSQPVTALTVVLRLADTPGLSSTGAWSTIPNADMTITETQGDGVLVYTFTLHAGVSLAPRGYEFAAQYSHAVGGRDAGGDTYQVTASAGRAPAQTHGNFLPAT